MAKPIAEAGHAERMERALLAIEHLCAIPDPGTEEGRTLGAIYSLAHVARGRCCPLGRGNGKGWAAKLERIEADAKRSKVYDVDESLARPLLPDEGE